MLLNYYTADLPDSGLFIQQIYILSTYYVLSTVLSTEVLHWTRQRDFFMLCKLVGASHDLSENALFWMKYNE